MSITTFLFDLDGTLINSNRHVIHCFQHAWQTVMNDTLDEHIITETFGIPLFKAIQSLSAERAEDIHAAYLAESTRIGQGDVQMMQDADVMLHTLKERGAKTAVVTSKKRHNAAKNLLQFNLLRYVDVLIGPEDTPLHKPDPAPVLLALQACQAMPHEAIMVGDSPHDIASGHAAGVWTCGVSFAAVGAEKVAAAHPTRMIDHLMELLDFYGQSFDGNCVQTQNRFEEPE